VLVGLNYRRFYSGPAGKSTARNTATEYVVSGWWKGMEADLGGLKSTAAWNMKSTAKLGMRNRFGEPFLSEVRDSFQKIPNGSLPTGVVSRRDTK